MNKELEALDKLNTMFLAWAPKYIREDKKLNEDLFECIKSALKDGEWYKKEWIKFEKAFMEENEEKIKLKQTLEIIKENVGLKMSVDENVGCLYVPITKCFQPLEQNIVIVGYIEGKDKIDLLKEVLL